MTEPVALQLSDPAGEPLRIEWEAAALAGLERSESDPAWRLSGELDWDEVECLRIISGRLADDRLLALAALRPAGAAGHGDEVVAGAIAEPQAERFDELAEALISVEYGAGDEPSRIGLELYRDDGGLPLRIAADVAETADSERGSVRRLRAKLALRAPGSTGTGVLDQLRAT